ncbi:MAG TPA: NADH-quinone oxidoreductase subunit I [Candidatus Sulfotelmatobacter sp.]|nr:NADH-quinone oxidoreductase subunit I [Candidatus Sulfotelmatobacter sp.]HWI60051.1 NADH-quinone oxidoreductase subunit I [Bacillota bacterium]
MIKAVKAVKEVIGGLFSLFTGMRITLGQFFKPTVTVHYPHESLKMPARYRGHIELVLDPETNLPACIVCKLCEKACPSECITVDGIKPEGAKRKTPTVYQLDFTKCSLCGSCVEVCRDEAIRFSRDYNQASTNKADYDMDLLARLKEEAKSNPIQPTPAPAPVEPPKPAAPKPEAPKMELPKVEAPNAAVPQPAGLEVEAK